MNPFSTSPDLASAGLLVLRLILGGIMFAHGAQKVLGWFGGYGLKGTAGYFKNVLRIPAPLFYVAAFTEFLGGIAIAFGVFSRVAALGVVILMTVAIAKAHLKNGFFMNWGAEAGKGEGYEFNLALLAMAVYLLLAGPGQLAILS